MFCVPPTSNVRRAQAPENVLLQASETGLDRDAVANCTHLITVDRSLLTEPMGRVSERDVELVIAATQVVLGRQGASPRARARRAAGPGPGAGGEGYRGG
ncbi:MAG: type II toxin-antitoxin system PemK/MazF family toxin, partial [Candidatus Wallbacteria bacterium]|nr:type II toxin-antitoxin system PemK/MazF family toxin [Candidatus Wallbacteria bacterium]